MLSKLLESNIILTNTFFTHLCTCQCSDVHSFNIHQLSKYGRCLKREYTWEAQRRVPRWPHENSDFVQVLVNRRNSFKLTPSQTWVSSQCRPSEATPGTWGNRLSPFFLILTPILPEISQ